MGIQLGFLGTYCGIDIAYTVSVLLEYPDCPGKQYPAVYTFIARICVREMIAYVTQGCRPKQCIADGMDEHIGIGMAQQPQLKINLHASYYQVTALNEPVNIVTVSYPDHTHRPKMAFRPSISNDKVKRSVWSRGLLWAVDMRYAASSEKTFILKPAPIVKYLRFPLNSFS